ncbi:MAG: 3'-5' exonuclease [Desulfobulbaceae bacterium]|nr:3'-5' exonuclease [Desulfobulbaceae bacterium]
MALHHICLFLLNPMSALVVFDFETSGLKPSQGARVIEIGAVLVEDGAIRARFQRLVNPGFAVSPFITSFTGISNAMLREAANSAEVLPEFCEFCGNLPLVAHNARFDRAFLQAELARLGRSSANICACSMLAARRILPDAPRYRLQVLAEHCGLSMRGSWHRALADAEVTALLWLYMEERLRQQYGLKQIPFALMEALTRLQRRQVASWLRLQAAQQQAGLFGLGDAA